MGEGVVVVQRDSLFEFCDGFVKIAGGLQLVSFVIEFYYVRHGRLLLSGTDGRDCGRPQLYTEKPQ